MDVIFTDAYLILFEKDVIKIVAIDDENEPKSMLSTKEQTVNVEKENKDHDEPVLSGYALINFNHA